MAEALPAAAVGACEQVRLAYRHWAPDEPRAPAVQGILAQGQSHTAIILAGVRERWVLRVPRRPAPPGVCRQRELHIHRLAAAAGIAPAPVFADTAQGLLVTPLVAAATHDGTADHSACRRAEIAEVAGLLRSIHALATGHDPAAGEPMHSATRLAEWRELLGQTDPLAALPAAALAELANAASRIRAEAHPLVICHNDLLAANRLRDRGGLLAIDWEYAGPGDALFDVAVAASEFAPDGRRALLAAYLGREPTPAERRHLDDQLLVYLAIAACWYAGAGFSAPEVDATVAALGTACVAVAMT